MTASLPNHAQINIQYWLIYQIFYNSGCDVGNTLQAAQRQHCDFERRGIPIDADSLYEAIEEQTNRDGEYPYLFKGTTDRDYDEAKYVMAQGAVTYEDINSYWLFGNDDDNDVEFHNHDNTSEFGTEVNNTQDRYGALIAGSGLLSNNHLVHLTPETQCLHQRLEQSMTHEYSILNEEERSIVNRRVSNLTILHFCLHSIIAATGRILFI